MDPFQVRRKTSYPSVNRNVGTKNSVGVGNGVLAHYDVLRLKWVHLRLFYNWVQPPRTHTTTTRTAGGAQLEKAASPFTNKNSTNMDVVQSFHRGVTSSTLRDDNHPTLSLVL
jgi:hypothetical protein